MSAAEGVVLQRVVFGAAADPDIHPLYLDAATWSTVENPDDEAAALARARGSALSVSGSSLRVTEDYSRSWLTGRRSMTVPAGERVSLATYFNAFPASYWRRWTDVGAVVLRLRTRGSGEAMVYRSNARAVIQTVASVTLTGDADQSVELPLDKFLDGGWLWFDLVAGDEELELVEAEWRSTAAITADRIGSATVSITTLNKTDYCVEVLRSLDDEAVAAVVDTILVVDQGSRKVAEADGFDAVAAAHGARLRVIEQANLGGSGGFARGMAETLRGGRSDFVILLDDDVVVEPESFARSVVFASLCSRPTIVGSHMFDMYDRTRMHAYAEAINRRTYFWGPLSPTRHDFAASNIRQTPWLHQRMDAGYTGWWMCLIPTAVLREIGLSLPVFIKWDDAEFGDRALERGIATVSLPGSAIWHVSWVDKDDSRDWQAFYHARNRLVAALLHSDVPRGGLVPRSNLAQDLRYLLTMDYYTVALRLEAYRSVLAGPGGLHAELATRLPKIRASMSRFVEAQPRTDLTDLPVFAPRRAPGEERRVDAGPTGRGLVLWLLRQVRRHALQKPRPDAAARPEGHLSFSDARWWVVPDYDSVLISNAEGASVTLHVREPRRFRRMLLDSIRLNLAYRRRWAELAATYRAALPELTSLEAWSTTLGLTREGAPRP